MRTHVQSVANHAARVAYALAAIDNKLLFQDMQGAVAVTAGNLPRPHHRAGNVVFLDVAVMDGAVPFAIDAEDVFATKGNGNAVQ